MKYSLLRTGTLFKFNQICICLSRLEKKKNMNNYHSCAETCSNERLWYMCLWAKGMSFRSIARRAGRSPTTVRRWVRRLLCEGVFHASIGRAPTPPCLCCYSAKDINIYHYLACLQIQEDKT